MFKKVFIYLIVSVLLAVNLYAAEPASLPKWDENDTNTLPITTEQQDDGFVLKSRPASGTFNAWMRNVYKWTEWFQEKFTDIDSDIVKLQPVDSIADLRAITYTPEDGQEVSVLGYYNPGDLGGGSFYWDSTSTDTDNGIDTFKVTAITTGRFKRLIGVSISAEEAGVSTTLPDNVSLMQAFLDYIVANGIQGVIGAGTFTFLSPIEINGLTKLSGSGFSTNLYFTSTTAVAIKVSLSVSANNSVLKNFRVTGPSNANIAAPTQTATGIKLNPTLAIDCTRIKFEKIIITNFYTGINSAYAWSNNYDSIVITNCYNPLIAGSQTNNVLFNSLWVSNCWFMLDASNCQGLEFNSPLFQNCGAVSGDGSGIQIFQSVVTMNNPYFENTSEDDYITLGSNAEAVGAESSLTIVGGQLNPGTGGNTNIQIGGNGVHLNVTGLKTANGDPTTFSVPNGDTTPTSLKVLYSDCDFRPAGFTLGDKIVAAATGDNKRVYVKAITGADGVQTPTNLGYRTWVNTVAGQGFILTEDLVSGNWYTIALAVKKPVGGGSPALRHSDTVAGAKWTWTVPDILETTEDFRTMYMSFKAEGDSLAILFPDITNEYHLAYLAVYEGTTIPEYKVTPFSTVYGIAAPAVGDWLVGDTVINNTPVVGQPTGWKCTVSGTPGTWVALANL